MVTIVEVAKKAGVSNSTVTKVIRDYPNISLATRKRVLEAIDELGYVRNSAASELSSKNHNRIALIININEMKQSIDEVNMQYLLGAFHKADELNLNLMTIFYPMFERQSASELRAYLKSQGVTGFITYGLNKHSKSIRKVIESGEIPSVVVDAYDVGEKTTSVSIDNTKGQYEVAKQTILGEFCEKVLYIAGKEDGYVTEMRLAGIQKLKDNLGFSLEIVYGDFSEKKARKLTFDYGEEADVIVCASDLMAIGAKSALREMDIFRPICGFDGIRLMGYAGERMNTCKQDFYHISEVAVEEMQRILNGKKGRKRIVDFEIIRMEYEDVIF